MAMLNERETYQWSQEPVRQDGTRANWNHAPYQARNAKELQATMHQLDQQIRRAGHNPPTSEWGASLWRMRRAAHYLYIEQSLKEYDYDFTVDRYNATIIARNRLQREYETRIDVPSWDRNRDSENQAHDRALVVEMQMAALSDLERLYYSDIGDEIRHLSRLIHYAFKPRLKELEKARDKAKKLAAKAAKETSV